MARQDRGQALVSPPVIEFPSRACLGGEFASNSGDEILSGFTTEGRNTSHILEDSHGNAIYCLAVMDGGTTARDGASSFVSLLGFEPRTARGR